MSTSAQHEAANGINLDDEDDLNDPADLSVSYEQERLDNIRNNAALLASLGLSTSTESSIRPHKPSPSQPKKPKPQLSAAEDRTRRETKAKAAALRATVEPTRRSTRVALQADAVKLEPSLSGPSSPPVRKNPLPKSSAPVIPAGPSYSPSSGSSSPAPGPTRYADGTLVFEGRWKGIFTPNRTPEEMFSAGAFAGAFFCDTYSNVLRAPLSSQNDIADLPFTLPTDTSRTLLSHREPDGALNRFKVRAGQSLQEWEKAGWIWDGDPRGWAQWYVRFWGGRRCEDDERQVRRWLKVAGPTGRFKRALLKKVVGAGGEEMLGDEDVGRVLRQCLWQWGYELNQSEFRRAMAGDG